MKIKNVPTVSTMNQTYGDNHQLCSITVVFKCTCIVYFGLKTCYLYCIQCGNENFIKLEEMENLGTMPKRCRNSATVLQTVLKWVRKQKRQHLSVGLQHCNAQIKTIKTTNIALQCWIISVMVPQKGLLEGNLYSRFSVQVLNQQSHDVGDLENFQLWDSFKTKAESQSGAKLARQNQHQNIGMAYKLTRDREGSIQALNIIIPMLHHGKTTMARCYIMASWHYRPSIVVSESNLDSFRAKFERLNTKEMCML